MSLVDTCLVDCPYCGEILEFAIDCPDGRHQYTEDCHVCCQPIAVDVTVAAGSPELVSVAQENE